MVARVQVRGARELRATLRRAGLDLQDLKTAHREAARIVVAAASRRAPRRSGRLAGSGRPGSAATAATIRFGGAATPYANAIQWGYRGTPGQPGPHNIRRTLFATKAASDTEPTWTKEYLEQIDQILSRVKGV